MTGIVVLCRYNSSRLPGKILRPINGKELLGYILERLETLQKEYPVVICTSVERTDDPIVDYCVKKNIDYYRGDLNNVAKRFLDCCQEHGFRYAVRINGDNIFLDYQLIERMIGKIESGKLNFVSNVKKRTFPKGMSVEIVDVDFYKEKYPFFSTDDLEHVMTYFYRTDEGRKEFVYDEPEHGIGLNFAVDTMEDLKGAERIIAKMDKDHRLYGYREIIDIYKRLNNDK